MADRPWLRGRRRPAALLVSILAVGAALAGCQSAGRQDGAPASGVADSVATDLTTVTTRLDGAAPVDAWVTAREAMVRQTIEARGVRDPRVLAAMRTVQRHRFVPEQLQSRAYGDHPLPIGAGQTISQPYIVALMSELLELEPGQRVLEIGTGSGYQAAVLAELTDQVYSIEIIEALERQAAALLAALGYAQVRTRAGDGYRGWPELAPFDAIIVTAAPDHVPQPLIEQLRPGGRLVIPVGDRHQELLRLTRRPDGGVDEERVIPVRFVPMTGEAQRE